MSSRNKKQLVVPDRQNERRLRTALNAGLQQSAFDHMDDDKLWTLWDVLTNNSISIQKLLELCNVNTRMAAFCRDNGFWLSLAKAYGYPTELIDGNEVLVNGDEAKATVLALEKRIRITILNPAFPTKELLRLCQSSRLMAALCRDNELWLRRGHKLGYPMDLMRKGNAKASVLAFEKCSADQQAALQGDTSIIARSLFRVDTNSTNKDSDIVCYLERLPTSVTKIDYKAFAWCNRLSLETLPGNLTDIGEFAFYCCTSLALKVLPPKIKTIDACAFVNCPCIALTALPEGLTTIKMMAFVACTALSLQFLPSSVTKIESQAFFECTSLALQQLPDALTDIGYYAFYKCTSLKIDQLPTTLQKIGDGAFAGCDQLSSVVKTAALSLNPKAFTLRA